MQTNDVNIETFVKYLRSKNLDVKTAEIDSQGALATVKGFPQAKNFTQVSKNESAFASLNEYFVRLSKKDFDDMEIVGSFFEEAETQPVLDDDYVISPDMLRTVARKWPGRSVVERYESTAGDRYSFGLDFGGGVIHWFSTDFMGTELYGLFGLDYDGWYSTNTGKSGGKTINQKLKVRERVLKELEAMAAQ